MIDKPTKNTELDQKPVDGQTKSENDKNNNDVEVITHKSNGPWSKKWVRIVVIISSVIASLLLVWLVFRLVSRIGYNNDNVTLDSSGTGIDAEYWNDISAYDREDKVSEVIPIYRDDAVIYFFETSGITGYSQYNQVFEDAKSNAQKTIDSKHKELQKKYKNDWADEYKSFLENSGYHASSWQAMEQQWWNDLVASAITPTLTSFISWQTYAKNDDVIDENNPWCTDTATSDICFGTKDYVGTTEEMEWAKEFNKLIRTIFICYLLDYMPLSASQIQIKFDFGEGNPTYSPTMRIDAENIRHWWHINEAMYESAIWAGRMDWLDFEYLATNYSAHSSKMTQGRMPLEPTRSINQSEEVTLLEYIILADKSGVQIPIYPSEPWYPDYPEGVPVENGDPRNFNLIITNEQISSVIDPIIGTTYDGQQSYDSQINTANKNNEIGNAIWAQFPDRNQRYPSYRYAAVPAQMDSIYTSSGAEGENARQNGYVSLYSTIGRDGIHFMKINGLSDVTDVDASPKDEIVPTRLSLWYTRTANGEFNDTTYFDETNINVLVGMGMELMREDMVAMAGNINDPGVYGIKASYNNWLSDKFDEIVLWYVLEDEAFLERNHIIYDPYRPSSGPVTSGELRSQAKENRVSIYTKQIFTSFKSLDSWYKENIDIAYLDVPFYSLYTAAIEYMTLSWVDEIDISEVRSEAKILI